MTMNSAYMIELDISHEITDAEVVAEASQFNCIATLIEDCGPAGGNPVYIFESKNYDDLHGFASVVLDTDDQSWVDSMIEMYDEDGQLV